MDNNFLNNFFSQSYLTESRKKRLNDALKTFFSNDHHIKTDDGSNYLEIYTGADTPKNYTHFYSASPPNFVLQGDLIRSIRFSKWDNESETYAKKFINAIVLSNTCDIEVDTKKRSIPNQIVLAPIIPLKIFKDKLEQRESNTNTIKNIVEEIRNQKITNIFYLPSMEHEEHLVFLDEIFWYPTEEFHLKSSIIVDNRIASLDDFGFYILLLKLSYHFCRLPEDDDSRSV